LFESRPLKYKYKKILLISFLNICILICVINVNVKAQSEYTLPLNENEEFIWEVTSLDLFEFEQVLGFEPNFALGDRIRLIIRDLDEAPTVYDLTVEFWDYKTDWGQTGDIQTLIMSRNPNLYDDFIFVFSPVEDYLSAVIESKGPEYSVTANSISKITRADTGRDYIIEKIYDRRGIPISETFYEYTTDRVIVRIEGSSSSIPSGFYFIGFFIIALTAIIFITIKKKRLLFQNH